jgi:hypothetical protein
MLDRLASIFDAEREQDRIAKEAARDAWDALKKKVWPDEAEAG